MTIDERKFVVTALELLREIEGEWLDEYAWLKRSIEGAIKALEVALGL